MKKFDLLHTPLAGRNLIEASAGTGKTFTIAGVYLRLVVEEELDVSRILVVTFTEAATKELKERIRQKLKDAETSFETGNSDDFLIAGLLERTPDPAKARRLLASAVRSFDEAAIFTIHGFCQRMLQDNPFESGSLCDTELLTDQEKILKEIAQDYWRINCYGEPVDRIAAADRAKISPDSLLKLAKRVCSDPYAAVIPDPPADTEGDADWLLALKRNFFDYLRAELPKRKRLKNVRCFDDLLGDLHAALTRAGSTLPRLIRERFQAALIDEFQDTDPVQFAIFDAIYPVGYEAPFFLIGDPKQAIYSFRGADIFAYLGAADATEKRHTLLQNFRSEPGLITAVNKLFTSRELPFLHEKIGFNEVEAAPKERSILTERGERTAPLKFWFAPRKEEGKPINKGEAWDLLPETVASEIARILRGGAAGNLTIEELKQEGEEERWVPRPVRPRDVAVLVRANRQARLMQQALSRRGIPSVLCSAGNLFETDEAAELLRLLSAVAQPGHEALLRGALATDLVGVTGSELAQLVHDEERWEEILEEFRGYHDTWNSASCMAMALQFLERRKVRQRLLSGPMGERRLTNVLHAIETIHQAQVRERLGMEGVVAWLSCRITEEPKKEEYEVRLETDEAAVQLVTIHKSKGLEYPIVFLPFCWAEVSGKDEGALFHDDNGKVVLDIGSEDLEQSKAKAAQEALAESLRLLYVALTRGKHRTYVIWGAFKDAGDSSLHYLLHPDQETAKGQVTLSDEDMRERLAELAAVSAGSIEQLVMPAADLLGFHAGDDQLPELAAARFTGTITRDWRVASFTSLSSRQYHTAELPDRDETTPVEENPVRDVEPTGIFAFPKGAKAGIFLHKIFEDLDFTQAEHLLAPLVEDQLDKHGFSADWSGAVRNMVLNVLQAPLGDEGITLAQVPLERRLTELEFFFPLAQVTSECLKESVARFMARHGAAAAFPVDMAELFNHLSFAPVRGMLLGFIDLVFEQDGRYYIVDWKSNHLGNTPGDYGRGALKRGMEANFYPLQYLLYTVALDSYLGLRIPDYDYDRHFGGIFYLFLRGVDGTGNGVFADRPPKEFIQELAGVLLPESVLSAPAIASTGWPARGAAGKKSKKAEVVGQLSLDLY
ncbi:exodeoxyribonuclease V subunit beta [Geomonas nitrogeniifigens]|uniref:DNA 3'-5' helicase n=1 Tax=Geomonas diazotrophica TaxID=2843197 RepID=A0ABX8JHH3_9BACT|nr:exodeoxyribonuclease V subunit beta [Geomonas nitrogeniifigens]QWV97773.1 exodeoxyribonuclease V subunit beta [Geomonas nitrogeniifigens]QXE86913.1 exodeoxyribonuclease V subunit beta [Geomonas nitrogeniifigens]